MRKKQAGFIIALVSLLTANIVACAPISSNIPTSSSSSSPSSSSSSSTSGSESLTRVETYRHVFERDDFKMTGGTTRNINGLTWKYSTINYLGGSPQGVQIGSKNNPQKATPFTLETALPSGVYLASYAVEVSTAKNGQGKLTVDAGDLVYNTDFDGTDQTIVAQDDLNVPTSKFKLSLQSKIDKAMFLYSIDLSFKVPKNLDFSLTEDVYLASPVKPGVNGIPNIKFSPTTLSTYYRDIDFAAEKSVLRPALHGLVSAMTMVSYGDAKTMLQYTDENPANRGYLYGLYDGDDIAAKWDSGDTWNREHVWACAQMKIGGIDPRPGNDNEKGRGTDIHNLRVACPKANSYHSNKFYDSVDSSIALYPNISSNQEGFGTHHKFVGDFRGDVARVLFYMALCYDGLELDDALDVNNDVSMGKLSLLLEWNYADPVDEFETQRNNRIYGYQGNRNPFIDYAATDLARTLYKS